MTQRINDNLKKCCELEIAVKKLEKVLKVWKNIVNIENEEEREIEMSCYFEEMPYYEIKALVENYKKDKEIISKLQADIEIKDKVIDYIAKHTYIRTGENGVLGTITEEVIEHLYKKVGEENE